MNYYPFHIGDYASHTKGLGLLEDLAYRRLLDEYYLHERPLNACSATVARQIGMADHFDQVEYVLITFFQHTPEGYINHRADAEIAKFHSKQDAASKAGKASAERRLNARSTPVQRPSTNQNQEPEPEPSSSTKKKSPLVKAKPTEVSDEVWLSFMAIRKAKRLPLTEIAMLDIRAEAVKAKISLEQALTVCCQRGWAGFKAEWHQRDSQPQQRFQNPADVARVTVPDNGAAEETRRKLEERDRNTAPPPADVRAKMQELLSHMKVKP